MAMDKNFDWSNRNDFANGEEIMVQITLAEYRDLVTDKARSGAKISEATLKQVDAEKKLAEAKKQIEELNHKLASCFLPKEGA